MDTKEFNLKCAKYLGILHTDAVGVYVQHKDESIPREFQPYHDANDRNLVIEAMEIDTVLLRNIEIPEWQASKKSTVKTMIIESGQSISDAQIMCIIGVLTEHL